MKREVSRMYGVLTEQGVALRALFVIDPDGIVQHTTINNLSVGRSVDETLRVLQACQYVCENGEVCPADWRPGDDVIEPDIDGAQAYFERKHVLTTV